MADLTQIIKLFRFGGLFSSSTIEVLTHLSSQRIDFMCVSETPFCELKLIYPHGISARRVLQSLEDLSYGAVQVIGVRKYDPRESYRPRFEKWIQETQPSLVPYLSQKTEEGDYAYSVVQGFWDCWIKALGKAQA